MKIKMEKEVFVDGKTLWRIYVDNSCLKSFYSEIEANEYYDNVKANYIKASKDIIKEETL